MFHRSLFFTVLAGCIAVFAAGRKLVVGRLPAFKVPGIVPAGGYGFFDLLQAYLVGFISNGNGLSGFVPCRKFNAFNISGILNAFFAFFAVPFYGNSGGSSAFVLGRTIKRAKQGDE